MNTHSTEAHGRSIALMKFLSAVARHLGVARDVYVVGGAVRNFLLGAPIKDIDVTFDSVGVGGGKDSAWFAKEVQRSIPVRTSLVTNQYGVAILTVSESWALDSHEMKGETIEIANARKESYDPSGHGKGYKPHMVEPSTIEDDVHRRDFTMNTLLWRMHDLAEGPEKAEILDLTGLGRQHLEERLLHTPLDPDKTFSDDPTRMLRAVRFVAKYNLHIATEVATSIRRNAPALKNMPWDAVRKIVTEDILDAPNPRRSIVLLKELGLASVLKEMLHAEPGMAAALGRSLNDHEAHVLLDLLDLGWVVRTPISFLDAAGQKRLREILLQESPALGKQVVEALKKPPVDQQALFTSFDMPPKERGQVVQVARQLLLADPALAANPALLERKLEEELVLKFRPLTTAEKVAARFTTQNG